MGDCEFLERKRRSGEIVELCNLTNHLCLVVGPAFNFQNCTRRTWAIEHPPRRADQVPEVTKPPE